MMSYNFRSASFNDRKARLVSSTRTQITGKLLKSVPICLVAIVTMSGISNPVQAANPQTCTVYGPPDQQKGNWNREAVWGDEFNDLDKKSWAVQERAEDQPSPTKKDVFYNEGWFSSDNVKADGNFLIIDHHTDGTNDDKTNRDKNDYSGAWVQTTDKFKKGYFEACVRLATNENDSKEENTNKENMVPTWSTFWLKAHGKSSTEFDVMEFIGDGKHDTHPSQTHHYQNKTGKTTSPAVSESLKDKRRVQHWHTWGLLWTDTEVAFYLNGEKQFSSNNPADANPADAKKGYLPIILSSSPIQEVQPKGKLPSFMVDFVRVYHSPKINASIQNISIQ